MSVNDSQAVQATARHLVVALESYEPHVRELVSGWLDMELYLTVSAEVDDLKLCCSTLPELSVPWVSLLISHAELVHCLWRSSQPVPPRRYEVERRLDEHLESVRWLRARAKMIAGAPGNARA
ncbi:MAG TPA: hypothetical protein VF522_21045 [Ramlibacter sp.]|uniref:hypothetical protein n=1 Tax=Ramlibacter sp. TaxID=1917967 RepID=UPI002ED0946D